MRHVWFTMLIQILFTLGIMAAVVVNAWSGLYKDAQKTSDHAAARFQDIIEGYETAFKGILIPITDKLKEDPSFDEMQSWLLSKDYEFRNAVGEDAYDGIALTYKGGYAHSWDYGDYTNYDPNTRPWYQEAQKADGKIAVVAPYVTYTSDVNTDDQADILMTIAQKYDEEISFDLDLLLPKVKSILEHVNTAYRGEKVFIYNAEGQILSCTDDRTFAHNIYKADDVITAGIVKMAETNAKSLDVLQIDNIDGTLQYLYFNEDINGNIIGITVPAGEVFLHDFMIVALIGALLILFIIYIFIQNQRNAAEFQERDHRLHTIEDKVQKERLYVDVDHMDFYGNDTAGELCKNGTYAELYQLICSRIVDPADMPRMEEFLAPEVLIRCMEQPYQIDTERFLMNMQDKDGIMRKKTIEVNRMAFTQDRIHMVEISMLDAAESADLLKEALEAANQASASKGNFLSNMSHEIRTPLNAIIGYLTIAKDEQCTVEKKDYCIENCDIASRHLLQIINDILDMSSIENGKLKIAHEEFDLKKELSDITTIFFQNAKAKMIDFETHIENLTEEWVIGDQLRVNQVLMNLLSNAVKFTPEHGKVCLKVEQLRKDETRVYMQFTVSDTGIGMSQEYMSRIFQPFEQENAGTARKFGGSGLGLSITNNLVQMMGGKIDVMSRQNQGTTFTVTLYFEKAKGEHASNVHADYSHVRVLVVDDQEDECKYVRMMLKRCGAKADFVTGGEKALRQMRSRMGGDYAYDLCIVDWNMPEMNGGEVTRRIREEFSKDMPIIIATAYDITEFEEEARQAGANKVIAKPLFQSTLFDLLVSNFGSYDPEAASEKNPEKQMDMSGVHLLLAEDNPMNMDIAVTIMEKAGIKVDQAVNGKEASEKFLAAEPGTYNLILMDVQMPVMDGFEATKTIRESNHPEAKTIPIIAMTANAFAEDVAEALAKGMNAHIAKPINYDKLFELLKKFSGK